MVRQIVLIDLSLRYRPIFGVGRSISDNFCVIVDCQKKISALPFIDFTEAANLLMKNKKGTEKRRKSYFKKIYHDHWVVEEGLGPDIQGRSEIAKGFCYSFEFDQTILNGDIFLLVFVLVTLQMPQLVQVLRSEFVAKNSSNLGLEKSGITTGYKESSKRNLIYEFFFFVGLSLECCNNHPWLDCCNLDLAFFIFTTCSSFNFSQFGFDFALV